MSYKSTEFADEAKELKIQQEQLENWELVIKNYPNICSKLKCVMILQQKLQELKTELQALIDSPAGSTTNIIRNIQLINVDLPETKKSLEDSKSALIDTSSNHDIPTELNLLFLEFIRFEQKLDFEKLDVEKVFEENIKRISIEISILNQMEKSHKRKWYQIW